MSVVGDVAAHDLSEDLIKQTVHAWQIDSDFACTRFSFHYNGTFCYIAVNKAGYAVSDISEVFETGIFSDLITSIGVVDTIPDISNIDISLKNAENYEKILEKGRYTEFDSYKISEILDSDYLKIIVDLNCGESGAISFSSY